MKKQSKAVEAGHSTKTDLSLSLLIGNFAKPLIVELFQVLSFFDQFVMSLGNLRCYVDDLFSVGWVLECDRRCPGWNCLVG